jgi:hypothetical protein
MNRIAMLVAGLLCVAFLVLLSPFILHPSLYTIGNESFTQSQANPAALEQLSQEKSGELYGLMQDLLDAPQPVVLNIRIHDFEEAERAFEEYRQQSRSFDKLVVSLELDESAVGDFQKENRKNMAALERMINESAQFQELNQLEITYRSEQNPSLLYTVTYEGQAIQQAITKTSDEFRARSQNILEISQELGLNVTRYLDSVKVLKEIADADRVRQNQRVADQPALRASQITLSVLPAYGTYGDTLQVRGTHTFRNVQDIVLYLDSREWKTVRPDQNNIFGTTLAIGKIRSGLHLLFARSGNLNSNIVSFTIVPVNSTLSLQVEPGGRWEEVVCTGSLMAGEVPVSGALVGVLLDGVDLLEVPTAPDGTYETSFNLTEGEHTLQTVFDGVGYPLNPSESEVLAITASPSASPAPGLPVTVLAGIGFIGLATLGAVWYLRRQGTVPVVIEPEAATVVAETPPDEQKPPPPPPVDVLISYQDLFTAGNWGEAAYGLYRSLTARLFPDAADPLAKTPRELLAGLGPAPVAVPFRSFVGRYEEVRYGGLPLQAQDPLLTHWNAVISLLEEAAV